MRATYLGRGQAGFDPTQPPGGMSQKQRVQKRSDYERAMGSCLDGRGYTVKLHKIAMAIEGFAKRIASPF